MKTKRFLTLLFCVALTTQTAKADYIVSIDSASLNLSPNTANQAVDIVISGTGVGATPGIAGGLNLRMVIGDGIGNSNEFKFNGISVQDGAGGVDFLFDPATVFVSGNGTPRGGAGGTDDMLGSSDVTILGGGPVTPSGSQILARVLVDTTGFNSGAFALTLNGTIGAPAGLEASSFVGTTTPVVFNSGTLAISVPEPTAFGLVATSLVPLLLRRRRS